MAPETNLTLIKRLVNEGGVDIMEDLKNSLVFGANWGDLLRAAPEALCHMGQCYVVAAVPKAALIELPQSAGLKYKHVRSNLVHCADFGRDAFREAESQMNRVQMTARYICEPRGMIDQIMKALANDRLADRLLPKYLKLLEELSGKCETGAKTTQDKFVVWEEKVQQIFLACQESESTTQADLIKTEEKTKRVKRDEQFLQKMKERIAEEKKQKDEEVKRTRKDYDEAYKKLTPGFKDFISDAGYDALDITKKVMDTGLRGLDTMMDMAQSVARERYPGMPPSAPRFSNSLDPVSAPAPDYSSDYSAVLSDAVGSMLLSFQTALFTVNTGDFDLNLTDVQSGLIDDVLADLSSRLNQQPLVSSPDGTAISITNIFKSIIDVATEIKNLAAEVQKNPDTKPNTEIMRKWQGRVSRAINGYTGLLAKRSLPGQRGNNAHQGTRSGRGSRLKMKYEKFQFSRQDMLNAERAQREVEDREREAEQRYHGIKSKFEQLKAENVTLAEVKKILEDCLDNVLKLKEKVYELSTFFSRLHEFVSSINNRREGFHLKADATGDILLMEGDTEYKQGSLKDLEIDAKKLRIYYAVAFELAAMYTDVSRKFIMPGINMMDRLSLSSVSGQADIDTKIKQITDYTTTAHKQISEVANKRGGDLRDAFMERRGEAEEVTS